MQVRIHKLNSPPRGASRMHFPQWYYIHRQQRHKSRAAQQCHSIHTGELFSITETCQCCDSANVLLGRNAVAALGNEKSWAAESLETRWLLHVTGRGIFVC